MPNVLRIIDANANRAREALRVMEEAARFLLNDAELSAGLKKLRHRLAISLAEVPGLSANRDTFGDVGTEISTPQERTRDDAAAVVLAAGKRLSEALRAIEEYAKTLPAPAVNVATDAQRMRYLGYDLEQRLNLAMGAAGRRQFKLCLLLTESLCKLPWQEVLIEAIEAGVDCVQVREKEMEGGALLDRAIEVIEIAKRKRPEPRDSTGRLSVIVNDRPDIALLAGADGVHLGQGDLPIEEARRLAGRQLLIGVSTSRLDQARAAARRGADYVGLGPMFATKTKHKPVLAGPSYLREFVISDLSDHLPHLAIGGITAENINALAPAGVRGIAVSSCVCNSPAPGLVVETLLKQMQ